MRGKYVINLSHYHFGEGLQYLYLEEEHLFFNAKSLGTDALVRLFSNSIHADILENEYEDFSMVFIVTNPPEGNHDFCLTQKIFELQKSLKEVLGERIATAGEIKLIYLDPNHKEDRIASTDHRISVDAAMQLSDDLRQNWDDQLVQIMDEFPLNDTELLERLLVKLRKWTVVRFHVSGHSSDQHLIYSLVQLLLDAETDMELLDLKSTLDNHKNWYVELRPDDEITTLLRNSSVLANEFRSTTGLKMSKLEDKRHRIDLPSSDAMSVTTELRFERDETLEDVSASKCSEMDRLVDQVSNYKNEGYELIQTKWKWFSNEYLVKEKLISQEVNHFDWNIREAQERKSKIEVEIRKKQEEVYFDALDQAKEEGAFKKHCDELKEDLIKLKKRCPAVGLMLVTSIAIVLFCVAGVWQNFNAGQHFELYKIALYLCILATGILFYYYFTIVARKVKVRMDAFNTTMGAWLHELKLKFDLQLDNRTKLYQIEAMNSSLNAIQRTFDKYHKELHELKLFGNRCGEIIEITGKDNRKLMDNNSGEGLPTKVNLTNKSLKIELKDAWRESNLVVKSDAIEKKEIKGKLNAIGELNLMKEKLS